MAPLGVRELRAGRDEARVHEAGEGDARLAPLGGRGGQRRRIERLDRVDARLRGVGIGVIAFDAEVIPAQALGDRPGRAAAKKRIEHEVAGVRGREHHPRQKRFRLLGRMGFSPLRVLEAFAAGADREQPVGTHLAVFIRRLQRFVIKGVALGLRASRGPDHGLMGVGEAAAAKIRHRIGLAPDNVVQDPESEILHDGADAKNIMVGADDENRRLRLHDAARGLEPVARECVVFREIGEFVPVVVDARDQALIGPRQFIRELEVVGRVGENEIHAFRRHCAENLNAVSAQDAVARHRARQP